MCAVLIPKLLYLVICTIFNMLMIVIICIQIMATNKQQSPNLRPPAESYKKLEN